MVAVKYIIYTHPSPAAIWKTITREGLDRHCQRRTRRATETTTLMEALLLRMTLATDANGARLFSDEHLVCLQDPPDVSLYTVARSITKGGVTLPVLHCARGTTSLESFHLHLARYHHITYKSTINYRRNVAMKGDLKEVQDDITKKQDELKADIRRLRN